MQSIGSLASLERLESLTIPKKALCTASGGTESASDNSDIEWIPEDSGIESDSEMPDEVSEEADDEEGVLKVTKRHRPANPQTARFAQPFEHLVPGSGNRFGRLLGSVCPVSEGTNRNCEVVEFHEGRRIRPHNGSHGIRGSSSARPDDRCPVESNGPQ